MVTMMLVEDESFERFSWRTCIDWELIGVQIVGEAANGTQGLAKVLELHPDIVLTDVKMPVMDGIEMSKKIKNIAPATKIIFISSYDDFEYAKQAVNLNAIAYVTKPVNDGELLMIVKRAADEIMEKALEQKLANRIKNSYNVNLNLARQAIINRAVTGLHINIEDANNLGLSWLCNSIDHLCILLSLFEKEKTETIDSALSQLNRQVSKTYNQSISACLNAGVLVTIASSDEEITELSIQPVKEAISTFLKDRGCGDMRLEYIYENRPNADPASLYLHILQSRTNYMYPTISSPMEKKNKQQIVNEILNIIHTQYHMNLTIEIIARNLHFTPNYLGSIFKTENKIGINRYLNNYRLEKAKELLQNKEIQVNDIALQCGYDNITYFYTVFKKECGITPNEYRQQVHGE